MITWGIYLSLLDIRINSLLILLVLEVCRTGILEGNVDMKLRRANWNLQGGLGSHGNGLSH